ncbi:hypothetical protein FHR93_000783 [Geodermatophilus sabuli]|uniref:Uncharacterized protein n=1 Tax=Geodermatophilus sabuli TaxID=1564158 RepID=A0A285E6D8_9ACTN|nr:hypothetical protein [Geodermatophilus sabuli]SNX94530.1 hypothetical protein SAMN06893097_101326 [Geodermatophilus sabuli]
MVGVEVGQEDQRQAVDAEAVQTAVDGADVRPGVDQHPLARAGGDDEGVALADVAGDQHGVRRGPPAGDLADRPAQDDHADEGGQRQGPRPREAPEQPADGQQQDGQQHRPPCAGRPGRRAVRERRGQLGHHDQPTDRPPGQPHEGIPQGRHDHPDQGRQQAEHGGDRHDGSGQQVRRQRDGADQTGQPGHQRGGGEAGRGGHGHRVGEQLRPAAGSQPARPAGSQQHDGRGGQHGEREAGVPRELRVEQQQDDDGGTERRHGGAWPAAGQREQRDRTHRRRPDDARAGPGEQHEPDQGQDTDERLDPAVDRPPPQRDEHAGQHDRHVGPADGGEVREPGAPEVLLEDGVHRPGVPHHEAREQPTRLRAEHPHGGRGERVPDRPGHPLTPGRTAQRGRWRAGRHPGHQPVARVRRRDRGPEAHRLPRQQPPPLLGGREEHHVVGQPGPGTAVVQPGDRGLDDHPRRAGTAHGPGVAVEFHVQQHRPPRLGHRDQGGGLPCRGPDRGGAGGDGHRGEDPQQHHRRGGTAAARGRHRRDRGRQRGRGQGARGQESGDEGGRPDGGSGGCQPQVDPRPAPVRHRHTVTSSASSA